jgi:hypothetical protein
VGSKLASQIGSLEERLRRLKHQKQRTEARTRFTAARRARREELRRKVLVGAIVLARVERGELEESVLRGWLDPALERAEDRALFDLE